MSNPNPPRKAHKGADESMVVALRALKIARSLARAEEKKIYQQTSTQTNYLAGVVTTVSNMAQGDTVSTRTGDSVSLKRLKFRANLACFTDSTILWRVIVLTDLLQVAGTAPTVAQVLESDSAIAPFLIANAGRFKVWEDRCLSQNARFLNGDMSNHMDFDINLQGLQAKWSGPTIRANQVFVLITCDVASTGSMVGKPAAGDAATRFSVDLTYTDD